MVLQDYFNAGSEIELRGLTGEVGHLYYASYILRQLAPAAESRILDIGCGDGAVLAAVKKLRPDLDCVGIDFADKQIAKARCHFHAARLGFEIRDVLTGPLDVGTFDGIYSFSVVQYFTPPDFQRVCSNLRASLKRNGLLIHMSIPNISKRVLLFQQSFLDQRPVTFWRSWLHLAKMVLVDAKRRVFDDRRYGSDSFFHDAEHLAKLCENRFQARIVRPSDSWYRFDIHLTLK